MTPSIPGSRNLLIRSVACWGGVLAVAVAVYSALGCDGPLPRPNGTAAEAPTRPAVDGPATKASALPNDERSADVTDPNQQVISVPEADLKVLADGDNRFTIDLYKKVAATTDGNIVVSPYSVRAALAMTYAGARGQTAEEMAKVLHFDLPPDRLHPAFAVTQRCLESKGEGTPALKPEYARWVQKPTLNVANALWGQRGNSFLPEFLDLTRRNYGASIREVDFASDPNTARDAINRWVGEKTRGKIKELIGPGELGSATQLVLTNAIYFKATWTTPFSGGTNDAQFEFKPDEKITVAMMHVKSQFKYYSTDECEWLALPYKDSPLSMFILLPAKGRFVAIEKALTASAFQNGVEKLRLHDGNVALPQFKVSAAVQLSDHLIHMGMPLAFSGRADFSGITGRQGLWIDKVNHQTYLSVDEQGSEAAAATSVDIASSVPPPFSFSADRPFLFFIRDNQTGNILFSGRVVRPSK
jgi:serpin B